MRTSTLAIVIFLASTCISFVLLFAGYLLTDYFFVMHEEAADDVIYIVAVASIVIGAISAVRIGEIK